VLAGCTPWPGELAESYRRAGYWRDEPLGWLTRSPRTALVSDADRYDYAGFDDRANRLAAGLLDLGIKPGERVVVQLPNVAEFAILCFALFRLGALPVMALPAHREEEIGYLCELTEASTYVIADRVAGYDYRLLAETVRRRAPTVRNVLVLGDPGAFTALADIDAEPRPLPPAAPDDVALFLLSGGTTGLPKLIPRTHDDYGYNARASAELCRFGPDTRYLVALPAAHNFPLACPGILGTLHAGGTVVFARSPSPDEIFPLIERERITATAAVPTIAQLWAQARGWLAEDLSSLRLLQVGGAKLSPASARDLVNALGCPLQQVFGMAEGLLNYTDPGDPPEIVEHTQGKPLSPADEIRIVDAAGQDVAPGETGELLTRGPYTLRGYYRAPEHNAKTFTAEGFYRSGDLVRRLPSGHLVVEGRIKDVINRGGDKVPATEVEDHLRAHPAIADAALVGLPHPLLGEATCACVVARGTAPTLAGLTAFLRDRGLATFKLPDQLRVVDHLPVTAVGKIDKKRLSEEVCPDLAG
jgi:2,3-dihydroxybenzoate-AMP ligase